MSKQITIRDVPDDVRNELASRAALRGQSMQEYLRAKLCEVAAKPPAEVLLARIRERKAKNPQEISMEEILAARDAERR